MALFTDGTISGMEDLRVYETGILDVAHAEAIELQPKLELAQREIAVEVTSFLLARGVFLGATHELTNVVVTEPVRQLHALHTLELIYRDAYNSQLNDRYRGKWEAYTRLSKHAMEIYFDLGVGLVANPIAKAEVPACSPTVGGSLPVRTYYARVAWEGASGQIGEMSNPFVLELGAGDLMTVMTGTMPSNARGWLVFAGTSESDVRRQSEASLAAGAVWVEPETGLRRDLPAVMEQVPDSYVSRRRQMRRG